MSRPMPKPGWNALANPYNPGAEPGEPAAPLCGDEVHPPAKVSLLRTMDDTLLRAIFSGYSHCARMVDGNITNKTVHRLYVAWAPGTEYAKLHATRCGSKTSGTVQSDTLVSDASSYPADMRGASPLFTSATAAAEIYMQNGTENVQVEVTTTGTALVASPDPDRAISMTPTARARLSQHEVQYAAGFCFEPIAWVADLETL